jgi:hypothetical protein
LAARCPGGKLEKLLDEHASQGWQLKAITSRLGRWRYQCHNR